MTASDSLSARRTRGFVLEAFGNPGVMLLVERPTPVPEPGAVLVDVEVAGVNFADTMIRRGEYLRDQPLSMAPGCEVVGHVAMAPEGTGVAVGTRVAAWVEAGGAYADRVVVPAHRVYPVPAGIPAGAIAAVFLQGTTADYAVHRFGRTQPGETVLVHGAAGGVGSIAVQLAKLGGATVIATASTDAKRELVLELGADVALDSRDVGTLTERLLKATDGRRCDVVVDGVGGPLFMPTMRALAPRGRYVVVGSASQEPAVLDVRHLLPRTQTVCGFILAHIVEQDPAEPSRSLLRLCDLVRDGTLRPRYESVPLEHAPDVHRRMEDRSLVGKVVLSPGRP